MELSNYIVQEHTSVLDAAAAIDKGGRQTVFICDGMRLLAVLSDGDLRRYVLRAGDLRAPVSRVANYKPVSLRAGERSRAQALMRKLVIRAIPILNERGEIVAIEFFDNFSVRRGAQLNIPVVIMAGGKGTRLAPYTDVLPKPLIPIGDKTITEHIMERFLAYGCDDFTMIVNHKKALVKAYFSEATPTGQLRFVEEQAFQGTGGGLKLLEGLVHDTFFMTNCDILVEADYEDILHHHRERGALITMVCALKKIKVPYGTVEMDGDGRPARLVEKPEYPLLTNTGLYVIEPEFVRRIPPGAIVHITELIQKLMDAGETVAVYPIGEAGWMDMGQIDELDAMRRKMDGGIF